MTRRQKYSQTLRVIGHDLEAKGATAFELVRNGNNYFVRATIAGRPKRRLFPLGLGFRSSKRLAEPGSLTESATSKSVSIHYTRDEIQRLDEQGRAKRDKSPRVPDFLSLPQILRTIGTTLDLRGGQLQRLSRPARAGTIPSIIIQYKTYGGDSKEEVRSYPSIYDLCVHMYKHRSFWSSQILTGLAPMQPE